MSGRRGGWKKEEDQLGSEVWRVGDASANIDSRTGHSGRLPPSSPVGKSLFGNSVPERCARGKRFSV